MRPDVADLDLVNDKWDVYGNVPSVVAEHGHWWLREVSRAPACNTEGEPDDLSKSPNARLRSQDACRDGPCVRGHLEHAKSGSPVPRSELRIVIDRKLVNLVENGVTDPIRLRQLTVESLLKGTDEAGFSASRKSSLKGSHRRKQCSD